MWIVDILYYIDGRYSVDDYIFIISPSVDNKIQKERNAAKCQFMRPWLSDEFLSGHRINKLQRKTVHM